MKLSTFRSEVTAALADLRKGSTFLTVHHYINNFAEISDYSIVFHVDYLNAVKRSAELLEGYNFSYGDAEGRNYTHRELIVAKKELLDSFNMTIAGHNHLSTNASAYSKIDDGDGTPINGVKLHDEQDILHLNGFRVHKKVLLAGNYPVDNRAAKTIAKDDIRARLPVGRYVQFKLTPGKFSKLVVNGMSITEDDVLRQVMEKVD